jgi:NAD(P)-dependent dehydrogenase (short-subunit alcohol dehydrogenase family)
MTGADRQVVVVTGASTGIGWATAQMLGDAGYKVLAGARREEDRARLTRGNIEGVILDVTVPAHIEAVTNRVNELGGRLAGLVNNAGIFVAGTVEAAPMSQWRRQYEVNVFGLVSMTQALMPALRAGQGRVVNISSVGGRTTIAGIGLYQSTKYAVESISDALRMEVADQGVKVVIVEPGAIKTEIFGKTSQEGEQVLRDLKGEQLRLYGPLMRKLLAAVPKFVSAAIPPERVGSVVLRALRASNPRTRYVVGTDAHLMLLLKYWLPDRAFDWTMSRMLGLHRPEPATPETRHSTSLA